MTEPVSEYERGVAAGMVDEKLREYGRHFDRINGSIDQNTAALNRLELAIQQLTEQALSRDRTVVTTAAALKEAEEARRDRTAQSWSPWQKLIGAVGGLAAVAAIIALIVTLAN
jgi:hypothetical protein